MKLFRPVSRKCFVSCSYGLYPPEIIKAYGVKFHAGIDFAPQQRHSIRDLVIRAAHAGKVIRTGTGEREGNFVIQQITTEKGTIARLYYFHMEKINIKMGMVVAAGSRLGIIGSTGNSTAKHLHFEVRIFHDGTFVPIDPSSVLAA